MLDILQDEEGELQLQRQSLLCRKKVSAFDLSRSGQMCGTGTMDGAPHPYHLRTRKSTIPICIVYSYYAKVLRRAHAALSLPSSALSCCCEDCSISLSLIFPQR